MFFSCAPSAQLRQVDRDVIAMTPWPLTEADRAVTARVTQAGASGLSQSTRLKSDVSASIVSDFWVKPHGATQLSGESPPLT
jgi:hypothetical protein